MSTSHTFFISLIAFTETDDLPTAPNQGLPGADWLIPKQDQNQDLACILNISTAVIVAGVVESSIDEDKMHILH